MIVIVGVGALGSHVLLDLRNIDKPIRVIDFDVVEQKNTQAQMHTRMSLRRNKAMAAQQAMMGMFGLRVDAKPVRLTEDNREQLLAGAELIIDCTDNIAARKVIQAWNQQTRTPTLHGALSADGTFAQVAWSDVFTPDAESGEGATCEDGEHLPFFAIAAAHVAHEAQRFLTKGEQRSLQITPNSVLRLA